MSVLENEYKGKKPDLNGLPNKKQVKILVCWKDSQCNTFSEFWIGGRGRERNGQVLRPVKAIELFLEFVWKQRWMSPAQTIEHAIWWVYYKGKGVKKEIENGV